jgi:GYF domain 2
VGPTEYTFMVYAIGSEHGPYSVRDLQMYAKSGNLKAATMIRRADGTGSWFAASEIPGVFSERDWLATLLISLFLGGRASTASISATRASAS